MANRSGVSIDLDTITGNLARLGARLPIVVAGVVERRSDISEAYLKDNAPWTDRTGNARASLRSVAEHTTDQSSITLMHGMPYGIWLEVKFAGRDGIIIKTLSEMGRGLMDDLQALMRRL
jgi:hypothetical protein